MLLPSLGTSIANVALPTLAEAFAASFQDAQWVVLAYLLATTTLIVSVGRLGDIAGRRRLLVAGTVVFTAASGLCGAASELWLLIAARAAQGAGAAVMMTLTMAFVSDAVPAPRIGGAMGLLGTMSAVGTALGPSLGGVLIASVGWQAIFLINVPLGVLALALVKHCLPADPPRSTANEARFDTAGTLLLALTLAAYALAMTTGHGSFGRVNIVLLVAATLGLGLFVWAEARVPSPLIHLARLRDPLLSASLALSALVSTVMMTTLVVGPFYLARAVGLDAPWVGIVMSVGPVTAALTGVPAGLIVDRVGTQRPTVGGLAGMVFGCAALSVTSPALGIPGYVLSLVIVTASYAVFQAANNTAVMTDVLPNQRGVVSGLLNLSRNLGLITGASVMGAVFTLAAHAGDVTTARPETVAVGMRVTFAVATALVIAALAIALGTPARSQSQTVRRRGSISPAWSDGVR
jgi:MFS family permease